jgi:hypothetical protein
MTQSIFSCLINNGLISIVDLVIENFNHYLKVLCGYHLKKNWLPYNLGQLNDANIGHL